MKSTHEYTIDVRPARVSSGQIRIRSDFRNRRRRTQTARRTPGLESLEARVLQTVTPADIQAAIGGLEAAIGQPFDIVRLVANVPLLRGSLVEEGDESPGRAWVPPESQRGDRT